jgi:hypothetical protein
MFTFVLVLRHRKSNLSRQNFTTLWKQAATVPALRKGNSTSVSITNQFLCLINFDHCFRTHVGIDIFSYFGTWNLCPKFVRQLHPLERCHNLTIS